MTTGEGDGAAKRSVARVDLARRAMFPVLLLALALFCVQSLQLLSSVFRDDLSSPPLVEVSPIDLGSSPVDARPAIVAGVVIDAPSAPAPAPADGVFPAVDGTPASEVLAGAAVVSTPVADLTTEAGAAAAAEPSIDVASAVEPPAAPAGDGEANSDDQAKKRRFRDSGPPTGRPVGPDCEDVPGRRAACDRRPQTD